MQYKLIALNDHDVFEVTINNMLASGWSLKGDLVVVRQLLRDGDFDECFYQGMIYDLA